MKLQHKKSIVLLGLGMMAFTSLLQADEPIQKTLAIHYEEGKTSEALFHQSLRYFQKLVEIGAIKSASLGTAKIFGEVIDFQTMTDSTSASLAEKNLVAQKIQESINQSNIPVTGKFAVLSTNILFGDKTLQFAINPYRGCYNHDFLAKGFEKKGYKIVDEKDSPDILLTIGIDACMSENEMKAYIKRNTSLSLKQPDTNVPTSTTSSGGTDLIRAGSSMQLGTPSGGGNTGMAVAGIGLAVNMVNWIASDGAPKERDMVRYSVTMQSKEKPPITFYPIGFTKDTHDSIKPISLSAYTEAEKSLYLTFLAWDKENQDLEKLLPEAFLEKNFSKSIEMIVSSKK